MSVQEQNARYGALQAAIYACLIKHYNEPADSPARKDDPVLEQVLKVCDIPLRGFGVAIEDVHKLKYGEQVALKIQYQYGDSEDNGGYVLMRGFVFGDGTYVRYSGDPDDGDAEEAHDNVESARVQANALAFVKELIELFAEFHLGPLTEEQKARFLTTYHTARKASDPLIELFSGSVLELYMRGGKVYLNNRELA